MKKKIQMPNYLFAHLRGVRKCREKRILAPTGHLPSLKALLGVSTETKSETIETLKITILPT